ncbi:MAG: 30S ribosomal protein S5 [Patescibacteria group bacterium]
MAKRNNNKDRGGVKKEEEFEQRVVDLARVTRVMAGGKRMKFRACLAIGDKKGRVGFGVAKGADVTAAITKAFNKAKKNLVKVPIVNETIPHNVKVKFKSAKILLKPAKKGTGVKAGGAVRILCELAGIANITAKILGSNNKINNVKATTIAFKSFKRGTKSALEIEVENNELGKENRVQSVTSKKAEGKSFKDKIKGLISKKTENK